MTTPSIVSTARALVAPGQGILAADESNPTMAKRLGAVGLTSEPVLRRRYREMVFTTPGLGEHISGVILFDETIRQHSTDGVPFPRLLEDAGMIPGIKVDAGTTPLPGCPGELVTEGLDRLRERLAEYAGLGARFAKWRAVFRISDHTPSATCVAANAHALARYAALVQEAGLTPVVEPEVLMDGNHSLERCADVTETVLREVYWQLGLHRVRLDGTLLKPNMVLPGTDSQVTADHAAVAAATLSVLRDTVPASVPGIVFLSGGQGDEEATARLDALNRLDQHPWELSFSFGRALQGPALRAWRGLMENRESAQETLRRRAALNGAARSGSYYAEMERVDADAAVPQAT